MDPCSKYFQVLTCVTQPFLQQRFQLAHVLKAQVESFKTGDGGLAEIIAIQFAHSNTNVSLIETHKKCQCKTLQCTNTGTDTQTHTPVNLPLISVSHLCESQLDASLFEGAGKLLQLLQVAGLFPHVTPVASWGQAGAQ